MKSSRARRLVFSLVCGLLKGLIVEISCCSNFLLCYVEMSFCQCSIVIPLKMVTNIDTDGKSLILVLDNLTVSKKKQLGGSTDGQFYN